jgi:pilus assembly protein CpaF
MTVDTPPLNGHRVDGPTTEFRRYHERIVNAIERARADLAERVADGSADGRIVRVDPFQDRLVAGDAASRELANIAQFRMEQGLPILPDAIQEELKTRALDSALGLGPLQPYRDNEQLEELVVNKNGHAFAWWGDGTKTYEGQLFHSDDDMIAFSQRVGRENGRGGQRLDAKHPFMRVDLTGGHRLVAVLGGDERGGVSTGPLLCLRLKRIAQPTLDGLTTTGMYPERIARQAEALTKGGAGQLIGGGMFSGKTTFLSAELDARWPDERLGTFERDVLELGLYDRWDGFGAPPDIVELYTRAANTEGEGRVDFDDLVARSRQWRLDRSVLGEIVHGPDAWEMLIASSGATYRSMATIHADDPTIVLDRLALYCAAHDSRPSEWQINRMIAQTIDVVWFCEIVDTPDGRRRRISSVREVGNVTENGIVASSEIWGYDPFTDRFTQTQPWSPGLLERLRRRGLNADVMLPDGGPQ